MFSLKELKENLKKLLKTYDIDDIFIFGSILKGKETPNDIDIALIRKEKDYKILEKITKELNNQKYHIEIFTYKEMFKEPIWKSFLSEAFSIKKNKHLHDLMNIKSQIIYTYSLKELNKSEKTMFNRGFSYIIKQIDGQSLSPGTVLIPTKNEYHFTEFLTSWPNAKIKKKQILLLL